MVMRVFGGISAETMISDEAPKAYRVGTVTVALLQLTKDVTFSSPMPSANYGLFFQQEANLAVVPWATNKTANGFRLNLTTSLAGTFTYLAIEV